LDLIRHIARDGQDLTYKYADSVNKLISKNRS
jgi:hypothetical protein